MADADKSTVAAAETEMAIKESAQTAQAAPADPPAESSVVADKPTTEPAAPAAPAALADPASAAATETKPTPAASAGPTWPALPEGSVLQQFIGEVRQITEEVGYDEVYGIHLDGPSEFHRNLILQKFLRANANDLPKATHQLKETLRWRKEFKPLDLPSHAFSQDKFGGLAFITILHDAPESPNKTDVACWNIYGSVTDNKKTFGDLDAFAQWRVAVMEAAMARLNLSKATDPIPNYGEGPDPYQMVQIHDYKNVSFLHQDPHAKAAARRAIDVFSAYYPETLSRKLFVNVPTIMGWMFTAMKLVLAKETVRKFTVVSDGKYLVSDLGSSVPKEYGGTGEDLVKGEQLKME